MSRKPKNHIPKFAERISEYVHARGLDVSQYSQWHMRIFDEGYTILDVWTTGRYYILTTDYAEKYDGNVVEREGEKGQLPITIEEFWPFLDGIFFGGDMSAWTDFTEKEVIS